jgi:hypothetical protein
MKIRAKTFIVIAFMMVFTMMAALTSSGLRTGTTLPVRVTGSSGNQVINPKDGTKPIVKDETVYALLNEDGSVRSVYVVNHSKVLEDGKYVDFGSYKKIESLSENIQPKTEGDKIIWELKKSYGDFYYKGELAGVELPWTFNIQYFLDGNKVQAQDLAGRSGRVEIALSVTANESVLPYFRERFAMQIQVPVNLNRASIISADGATQVITGKTNTLAYTILPGTSGSYRIVMEAVDFELESMSIGISAIDYGNVLSSEGLGEGIGELSKGIEDWVEGTKSFKNGLMELSNGMGLLTSGLKDLSTGSRELHGGMESFAQGYQQFDASLDQVSHGSKNIRDGLSEIAINGESILAGYQQLTQGILAQLPGEAEKEQLRMLAQYAGSNSPYAQAGNMAQSLLDQIAGLEQIYQNLAALNAGLGQYTESVSRLSEEYKGFDSGVTALAQASDQLLEGVSQLEDGGRQLSEGVSVLESGMTEISDNMKELPSHAQELIDGGLAIKKGTDAAISGIVGQEGEDEEIASFVAPEKGLASSVQFVIRTPAIKVPEKEKEAPVQSIGKKSFWQKFVDLFI